MLKVTRQYINIGGETLRTDEIIMSSKTPSIAKSFTEQVFERHIVNRTLVAGPADRTVDSIQLIGNFTDYESSSGDFLYVEWSSPATICDMSDLPGLGDTV